jgi:predicted metal-dependent hydrolase
LSGLSDRYGEPEATPLEYTVRVSTRARSVKLVMRPRGLEVVVPRGVSQRSIAGLVESRRHWIEKAAKRVEAQRRRLEEDPPRLPQRISLPAIGEEWVVEYHRPAGSGSGGASGGARVREVAGRRMVVTGDAGDFEVCKQALCRWLNRRARAALVPRLCELAERHGFKYQQVSVRQQKTRWGSCSRQGNISLNAKLMLMSEEAAEYVLLHELCHTVRMDHSPRFWALMEQHDPDYKAHKKLVRASAKAMPSWLDHEPDEEAM